MGTSITVRTAIRRIALFIGASVLIAGSTLAAYSLYMFLDRTSYRLVAVFLLLIILSNMLSRITGAFVKA